MIGQRAPKLTPRQEREAYAAATERDKAQCQRCGRPGPVERDHRQGRTAYNTVPSNLQCVCPPCHKWITEHPREAMDTGYTVSRWGDPADTPAHRYGIGWVLYLNEPDADGNWWVKASAPHA